MTKRLKTAVETSLINTRGGKLMFDYEAITASPHRAAPKKIIKPNDSDLSRYKRKTATATISNEFKNGGLLSWMIRRHLDYVSRFEINFRSGNAEFDNKVLSLLHWHKHKKNWDIAKRCNRDQWLRIFETSKTISGDAAGIKIKGGKMQGLNSDQIGKPDDWGKGKIDQKKIEQVTEHGLILGTNKHEIEEYCICYRNASGSLIFDHFEPAENVVFDGYFTAFNQTRGQSPILAAINDVIDMRDIVLFSKINLKLKNLFAMAIFRDNGDPLGGHDPDDDTVDPADSAQELTPGQVNILDLDANDKIQAVETNSPSPNAMDFMDKLARVAMLALDIPFTALDSSRASFSARIADRAEYEESCEAKRERNADILREIYEWRFDQWFAEDDELQKLAIAAGYTAERIVNELDFMPAGTPWMDKLTEVKADILSVSLGIESIPRIARRMGLDAYKIGKEQADYLAWAKKNGLPIFYANGGQEAVQSILTEPTNNNNDPAVNSGDSINE